MSNDVPGVMHKKDNCSRKICKFRSQFGEMNRYKHLIDKRDPKVPTSDGVAYRPAHGI